MERADGKGAISLQNSAEDFRNLDLENHPTEKNWDIAIRMFSERMQERYFDPIKSLLNDPQKNGFAIMALNCLLIDAFYQFTYGDLSTDKNKYHYTTFLTNQMYPIIRNKTIASKFYTDIRCGILHSAQTTHGSMLSTICDAPVELFNANTCIKVNVILFSEALENYYYTYISELKKGNPQLRASFLTKMNYICQYN